MPFRLTDGEPFVLRLRNGVLTHDRGAPALEAAPGAEFTLDEATLRAVLLGEIAPDALAARDDVGVTGEPGTLASLFAHLGEPDPDFAIVTP
ncbi:alkyl sulfatase C-terminal domain-containing protein [Streptomyces albidoflavus]